VQVADERHSCSASLVLGLSTCERCAETFELVDR
jgi:hypothetical protein